MTSPTSAAAAPRTGAPDVHALADAPDAPDPLDAPGVDLGAEWVRHMRAGTWEGAWRVSDRVLRQRAGQTPWHLPRHEQWVWDGRPLDGRRVLVRCYHGLGDTLQFVRFCEPLARVAREVTVWAQPELCALVATVPGVHRVLPLHDGAPEERAPDLAHDADVEVMELPHVFRATPATVPRRVPYVHAPAAPPLDAGGAGALHPGALHVGVVWAVAGWDEWRTIPPEALAPLAAVPGVVLHVLQHGPARDARPAGFGVESGSDTLVGLAGLMRRLDLVISVDSMPAHLAGALGRPVWTLLHAEANWRWMDGREDTPWYPTMRLFRQRDGEGWAPVVGRAAAALRALAGRPGATREGGAS